MHYSKRTPEKLDIEVRRPHFDLSSDLKEDWFDGSAFKTAFENGFSLLFPIGEKAFIESVRNFEDQISDPKLLKEIKAFYGQEAAHRKVHQQYNEMLCDLRGYDLVHLTKPALLSVPNHIPLNHRASHYIADEPSYEQLLDHRML